MQEDFHYYATYCAACLAGYDHEESLAIGYSAQLVDWCSRSFLAGIGAPLSAATTQLQLELAEARTDLIGLRDITRIWASFHFLPYDLHADAGKCSKRYRNKYRLICNPNGDLLVDTINLAKDKSLQAAGIAMHVLADTWAHRYFAGTPSLVINNTNYHFYEIIPEGTETKNRQVVFKHNPMLPDDLESGNYVNTVYQANENSIMNLGHGRAGHLPDYSFARYRYLPAWGKYEEIIKDNPADYMCAFRQMVYALKFLRGDIKQFEKAQYDTESVAPWETRINEILTRRQPDGNQDWKALGEELSGCTIEAFDLNKYQRVYRKRDPAQQDETFLGKFILAALAQKSMVTNRIFQSGNLLAGHSIDYEEKGFRGIKDFKLLIKEYSGRTHHE